MLKDVLNINPDIVRAIIEKAKVLQVKEEATFPEDIDQSEYEYDWAQVLADHDDDLTFVELQKNIEDLEPDQQVDLLALMYIGRGDFDGNEWSAAHKEARQNLAPRLAEYLLTKPHIADYLARGLELLGYDCNE